MTLYMKLCLHSYNIIKLNAALFIKRPIMTCGQTLFECTDKISICAWEVLSIPQGLILITIISPYIL